jgi:predicted nucleic acid-binding protein
MAFALLDTNVLVHAMYRLSPLHAAAARLVDRALRERDKYCISPQNLIEFAAVVSRPRLVTVPLPAAEVRRVTDKLFRSRRLHKIYPMRATVLRAIREGAAFGLTGPAWYDLYLAATMRDAGVDVVITENVNDFRRFGFVTPVAIGDAD